MAVTFRDKQTLRVYLGGLRSDETGLTDALAKNIDINRTYESNTKSSCKDIAGFAEEAFRRSHCDAMLKFVHFAKCTFGSRQRFQLYFENSENCG